ncbi:MULTISPECIES: hypothetical protein [unclassified Ruegeria]|uniref:hypothetical protein n=1 Tax=unclassified Ruegeria TaxID=2625375 RepID=UPI001489EE40|nr:MULTISPECIES: hypothetical protein [unclassified Ruegeria]NOD36110.1 hypothetical protein [Ruegeria sp. HKCCD7296]NOD45745.1 hypothetical protein [Ruegeria sp. HKCCD5849]NOD50955.1 hypothetical protein [Ruegeria sp. HKCCD5851]NOD67762.1 hypothetical protein [Ruegeria sp. HKCCD7303]NOE35681.1 hypothetical protein [Ruegeria sp. HKCCD7318]
MIRMLFPALVLSGPAIAHTGTHIHAHPTDYATLGAGLALIAFALIALLTKLTK